MLFNTHTSVPPLQAAGLLVDLPELTDLQQRLAAGRELAAVARQLLLPPEGSCGGSGSSQAWPYEQRPTLAQLRQLHQEVCVLTTACAHVCMWSRCMTAASQCLSCTG